MSNWTCNGRPLPDPSVTAGVILRANPGADKHALKLAIMAAGEPYYPALTADDAAGIELWLQDVDEEVGDGWERTSQGKGTR